jgi:hypothetical protein
VNLEIVSERMVKNGGPYTAAPPKRGSCTNEKLIVRWKTCGKTRGLGTGAQYKGIGARDQVDKITAWLGGDEKGEDEFSGLFIFEFDEEGRILNHVIERAEGTDNWDTGVGRFVGLTDWLLGRLGGKEKEKEEQADGLALGCCGLERRAFGRSRKP